jgi:uncharacterized protein with PIN domain
MSQRSGEEAGEVRFLADRMLGTLTRYLRFMGYDTMSANALSRGNTREDTVLLEIARESGRILLTRDRDLARRGGDAALFIRSENVLEQVRQLIEGGYVVPEIRMSRCSLCNTRLRPATQREIRETPYAPRESPVTAFFWCTGCRKLYWMGSHGKHMLSRLQEIA